MYLVSIYFDEKTNKKMQQYINKVAEVTGNRFMIDGQVPPHITISAFETQDEQAAISAVECAAAKLQQGKLTWVSAGQFFPYVIYLAPVLNEYLHNLSLTLYDEIAQVNDIQISPYYRPYQWFPHSTIGKKLTKEEMKTAFEVLQNSFGMFEGNIVKIGLAKPNPHRDIKTWDL